MTFIIKTMTVSHNYGDKVKIMTLKSEIQNSDFNWLEFKLHCQNWDMK